MSMHPHEPLTDAVPAHGDRPVNPMARRLTPPSRLQGLPAAMLASGQFLFGGTHRALWCTAQVLRAALPGAKPGPMLADRQDGPPDLDELWKDLNRKLSNVFSGRDGGGNGGEIGRAHV